MSKSGTGNGASPVRSPTSVQARPIPSAPRATRHCVTSAQPVLDAANALAAQAVRAFPKRLRADRAGGVRPRGRARIGPVTGRKAHLKRNVIRPLVRS